MPNSLAMTGGGLHFDTFMKALAGVQPEKAKPRKRARDERCWEREREARTLKVGRIIDTPKSD